MEGDRVDGIGSLLGQAEEAHGTYEASELDGVYDQAWPQWYAAYAVENGIGALLGHDVSADQLAAFFASSWAEFRRQDPKPSETWARYTARRIAAEL